MEWRFLGKHSQNVGLIKKMLNGKYSLQNTLLLPLIREKSHFPSDRLTGHSKRAK